MEIIKNYKDNFNKDVYFYKRFVIDNYYNIYKNLDINIYKNIPEENEENFKEFHITQSGRYYLDKEYLKIKYPNVFNVVPFIVHLGRC